jgi:hypothetical protein
MTTFALALTACEGGVVVTPSGVSGSPAATATISAAKSPEPPPFIGPGVPDEGCQPGPPYLSPVYDVDIVALQTVNVDRVTIQLINGSNLGGPMITFPQPRLTDEFGTTLVAAGHRRTFRFYPRFPCGEPPRAVAADLTLVDLSGATHRLTVSGSAQ